MKLKYLRHPIRTARAARDLLAARLEMLDMAKQGQRRFKGDKRYNLSAVIEGFSCHIDSAQDDTALLERICTAYHKSVERQKSASRVYDPTGWWQEVRQRSLRPVMNALLTRDLAALRAIYGNFFRDPCSTGLINVPYGMSRAYFGRTIKNIHCRYYLSDLLHGLEYWKTQTAGQFTLQALGGAQVGNPFGAVIEGTLLEAGAPHRHYCAQRIRKLLCSDTGTLVEIGSGFGGMAYYLLRDAQGTKYVDFDVPESIALASYYLMKAFPSHSFLLYGEQEPTYRAVAQSDVVLLPLFAMTEIPSQVAEASFSSHSMSDLSGEVIAEYVNHIARMTRNYFFLIGVDRKDEPVSRSISECQPRFHLLEKRLLGWHPYRNSKAVEFECLYSLEPSMRRERDDTPLSSAGIAICP